MYGLVHHVSEITKIKGQYLFMECECVVFLVSVYVSYLGSGIAVIVAALFVVFIYRLLGEEMWN